MNTRTLEEDRQITINNIKTDIEKLNNALTAVTDLTPEGNIILEDLLGLLHFNECSNDQVDALMIERRRMEKKTETESK